MRLTLLLALVVVALPAQAATTDISDRTPQVRDAIVKAASADDCAAADLAGVASLNIWGWRGGWGKRAGWRTCDRVTSTDSPIWKL